jgi:hypothetical protein
MRRLWFIITFIFLSIWLCAQETIVVGEVYDANTGEPLSNVNIYLQGTQVGTSTNNEGLFLLRKDLDRARTMIVSAVGYQTERFKIEPHTQVGIDIALKEKVGNIGEVFVVPQENPALPLMEKVRARREVNRRTTSTDHANGETTLYVSDIQSKHLKRALWKNLQSGMIQQADSTYLIPLYWRHQQADSIQEKATLLTLTDYHILLEQIPYSFDFYNNNLPFLSTSMLSPLAASGNMYYKYYLIDSTQVADEKHYLLHFRTKNPFYATFNGEMTIDSASYALRSIKVNLPTQNSINYLKEFTIKQTYTSNNQLQDEQLNILMDFAIKTNNDSSHIFPTLLLTRHFDNYQSLSPADTSAITKVQTADVILPALDSLNNTPLFKTAKLVAYVVQTGCIPTSKYVEIGKVHHVFKLSKHEGLRVGLPLRTTEDLWKNVCLEAMVAYGWGDHAWKGMGQINIAFPTKRRHTMFLKYSDEYVFSDISDFQEYTRENIIFNQQINLVTRIMQGIDIDPNYYYNTFARRQEARVQFADDWNNYLETQAYIKVGKLGYNEPTRDYNSQPTIFYSTIGASARVSFNERKIDTYFQRRHIYNHLPVIYVGAELGSYSMAHLPSYRMYGNLQLMLRHNVDLGIGGELNYLLQAGMVFGKVPYPFLHIFAGNQSYAFDTYRFSFMHNYQYAADQYVALHAHWNGKGVLFNMIPGIRYARLRELLEMKVAYGGLRQDHQSILAFPTTKAGFNTLQAPTTPYVELGVGIGNILRIGEVYGVFRLTQLQDASAPWWAIRFRIQMGM